MTELHAQSPYVNIDRAATAVVVDAPDTLEELTPREHSAAVLAKEAEERELLMRELAPGRLIAGPAPNILRAR